MRESAIGLIIPVKNDLVLSPEVYYADELTGIYFETDDEQFGRISFHNLDSIKVSRGEQLPYKDDWTEDKEVPWIYLVKNSKWLISRHKYEKGVYGSSYEFGGNVDEMLTDFNHFIFQFHDQFVEALARGFWWEKDPNKLNGRPLMEGHPFLPIQDTKSETFEWNGVKCKVRFNDNELGTLIANTEFCEQKLIEFLIEYDREYSSSHTLTIFRRNGEVFSALRGFFGRPEFQKKGVATYEEVLPIFQKHTLEISNRRKNTNN